MGHGTMPYIRNDIANDFGLEFCNEKKDHMINKNCSEVLQTPSRQLFTHVRKYFSAGLRLVHSHARRVLASRVQTCTSSFGV